MNRVLASLAATLVMVVNVTAAPVPTVPKDQQAKHTPGGTLSKSLKHPSKPYQIGMASWYGKQFHGRTTASGEDFDMFELTAAHRELPLGTYVNVTNLRNGKSIVVRVNDRGPFIQGRIMDLSYGAARMLGFRDGVERVQLDVVQPQTVAQTRRY